MTREEAIRNLEMIRIAFVDPVTKEQRKLINDTVDMAISALSETRTKGEWIRFKNIENGYYHIKCSKCGQYWSIADHAKIFKYCFNCGADMRGKNNC